MFSPAKAKSCWLATGVWLLTAISAVSGDKIQFSKPSQPAQTAPIKDSPSKNSSGVFDSYRGSVSGPLNFTPVAPRAVAPAESGNKEKDWIFARPEDGLTVEKALKIEDESVRKGEESKATTGSINTYIEQLRVRDEERAKANDVKAETDTFDSQLSIREDNLDLNQPTLETSDRFQENQPAFVTEYLKELRSPERERMEDMATARRVEFEQIFKSRQVTASTETLNNNLNPLDANRQPANIAPAPNGPADLVGRTTQTSFSDATVNGFEPLTGTRTSALEDVNSRALGRSSSSVLNTPTQTMRIQPQPAVLPFPSRPGSLFNNRP